MNRIVSKSRFMRLVGLQVLMIHVVVGLILWVAIYPLYLHSVSGAKARADGASIALNVKIMDLVHGAATAADIVAHDEYFVAQYVKASHGDEKSLRLFGLRKTGFEQDARLTLFEILDGNNLVFSSTIPARYKKNLTGWRPLLETTETKNATAIEIIDNRLFVISTAVMRHNGMNAGMVITGFEIDQFLLRDWESTLHVKIALSVLDIDNRMPDQGYLATSTINIHRRPGDEKSEKIGIIMCTVSLDDLYTSLNDALRRAAIWVAPVLLTAIFIAFQIGQKISRIYSELMSADEERTRHSKYLAIARTIQMLSHDIRRPFATLSMGIKMIHASAAKPDRLLQTIGRVQKALDKALISAEGMMADILEVDAIRKPIPHPCSLAEIVDESMAQVFSDGGRRNVTIEFRHTTKVRGDFGRLIRVVVNILENAKQATATGGDIKIETADFKRGHEYFVYLIIVNSGGHIDQSLHDQVFDSFFTYGKESGTGLGLAIAKKIVKDHGGDIWCKSSVVGGVEFGIRLPAVASVSLLETVAQVEKDI